MVKYKITNTSSTSSKGARNVFLIEAGQLLKPGEFCYINRIDGGTHSMVDAGTLHIEEGEFDRPSLFPDEVAPAPRVRHKVIEIADDKEPAALVVEPKPDPAPREPEAVKASDILGDVSDTPVWDSEPADDDAAPAVSTKKSGKRR